jgi:hypothetical protein
MHLESAEYLDKKNGLIEALKFAKSLRKLNQPESH